MHMFGIFVIMRSLTKRETDFDVYPFLADFYPILQINVYSYNYQ